MYLLTRFNHGQKKYVYETIEVRKFVVFNPGRRCCDGSTCEKCRVKPHMSDETVAAGDCTKLMVCNFSKSSFKKNELGLNIYICINIYTVCSRTNFWRM